MPVPELTVAAYQPQWHAPWDDFVRRSRNGHFMIERRYMEYHRQRFADESLLFLRGEELVAVLPAHRCGEALVSHGGLPFAGLVVGPRTLHRDVKSVFLLLGDYLKCNGLRSFVCTPTPVHYHLAPFEDDVYVLHGLGALCTSMKLSAGYAGASPICQSGGTSRKLRHIARRAPLVFRESEDVAEFWRHLEDFLWRRHAAKPVHSVEEMMLLKSQFPEQIRMVMAQAGGEIVGGLLFYLTQRVQRAQYYFRLREKAWCIPARMGLYVAAHPEFQRPWHDLGTSVDSRTGEVDDGLMLNKEITGARGTVVQTWTWNVL
jgi:Acetyltransferase (GNAT) domain